MQGTIDPFTGNWLPDQAGQFYQTGAGLGTEAAFGRMVLFQRAMFCNPAATIVNFVSKPALKAKVPPLRAVKRARAGIFGPTLCMCIRVKTLSKTYARHTVLAYPFTEFIRSITHT